jgi:uncharacterized protein (DUF2225 family)/CheY-like chemotaxis protein
MKARKKNQLVLVYSHDRLYCDLLDLTLREYGYRVRQVKTYENLGLLGLTVPTVAWFIDLDQCPVSPKFISEQVRTEAPDAYLVFMSSRFSREQVQECMHSQAIAVLIKPFHVSRLVQTISLLAQEPLFIERDENPQVEMPPMEEPCHRPIQPNDYSQFLRRVNLICPVCNNAFETFRFKLWVFPVSDTDADFCPMCPKSVHPELYSVMVCPKCLFAYYVGKFSSLRFIEQRKAGFLNPAAQVGRERVAIHLDFQAERTLLHGVKSFELAAMAAEQLQMPERTRLIAEFHLKSSWLCRRMGHNLREREAQEKALEYFLKIYQPYSNLPNKGTSGRRMAMYLTAKREPVGDDRQILVAGFLVGELSRRLGLMTQAKRYYEDVLRSPNLSRYSSLMGHFHEIHRKFLRDLEVESRQE